MKINSTLLLIVSVTGVIAGISHLQKKIKKRDGKAHWTIGILQTASHPALDQARESFIKTIKEKLDTQVEFIVRNAEGSLANAQAIAQNYHANPEVTAIYTIATPATQITATIEKEKPIIIAAVTDPGALGLIYPKTNVTGSSDMVSAESQITLIKQLVPTAQRIAVLYTAGEINSAVLAKKMIELLTANGFVPIEATFTNEHDLITALDQVLHTAQALWIPQDNIIALAIKLVADRAFQAKIPIITSVNQWACYEGVLATSGVDYEYCGQQAAQATVALLQEGKKPSEIPIAHSTLNTIFVNKKTAQQLGLVFRPGLEELIHFV